MAGEIAELRKKVKENPEALPKEGTAPQRARVPPWLQEQLLRIGKKTMVSEACCCVNFVWGQLAALLFGLDPGFIEPAWK